MSRVLYIEASPQGEWSKSIQVARAFLDAYKAAHPGDMVVTLDLARANLPVVDADVLAAKYRYLHGENPTSAELAPWKPVVATIEAFKSADKYVFSVPMWNFSIPYRLKQYIDVLVQPGLTFSYTPEEGYKGLVTGKPALIVCARGGQYPEGTDYAAMDMQTPYLKLILGFIGLTDLRWVIVEPTLMGGPDVAAQKTAAAAEKAKEMARSF
jgi:FMN-dependent NADH-azoreductase